MASARWCALHLPLGTARVILPEYGGSPRPQACPRAAASRPAPARAGGPRKRRPAADPAPLAPGNPICLSCCNALPSPSAGLSALAIFISYADRSNISTAVISMTQEFQWSNTFAG